MTDKKQRPRQPIIEWDLGTAHDFFISYSVLKDPKKSGVRSAWASGMRARLQAEDRAILDEALVVIGKLTTWLYYLPQPKDVESCLAALSHVPAESRLATLTHCPKQEDECSLTQQLLIAVSRRGSWNDDDLESLGALHAKMKSNHHGPSSEDLKMILTWWADAEKYGEKYLRALRHYYEVFFKEEEQRIIPKLRLALERTKERSKQLSSIELIEEVSHGIRYEGIPNIRKITLIPSYWISPFVMIVNTDKQHQLFTFGARPIEDSLVPGEPVPDALRVSLKALADPTRLRILRYLHQEPLTMAELTKRLRLRMPTVIHHLSALRLAGLVLIHVEKEVKGHRQRFSARAEGLDTALQSLKAFLESDQESA